MKTLVIAGLLLLAGCANPFTVFGQLTEEERASLTPASIVFVTKAELRDKQDILNTYAALPFCDPPRGVLPPCSSARVVIEAQRLLDAGLDAVLVAEARVRAFPDQPLNLVDGLTAAQLGLNRLAAYLAEKGIDEW